MISHFEKMLYASTTVVMAGWVLIQTARDSSIGSFVEQPSQCANFGVCMTKLGDSGYLLRTTQLKIYGETLDSVNRRASVWGRHMSEGLSMRGLEMIDTNGDLIITDEERTAFYGPAL